MRFQLTKILLPVLFALPFGVIAFWLWNSQGGSGWEGMEALFFLDIAIVIVWYVPPDIYIEEGLNAVSMEQQIEAYADAYAKGLTRRGLPPLYALPFLVLGLWLLNSPDASSWHIFSAGICVALGFVLFFYMSTAVPIHQAHNAALDEYLEQIESRVQESLLRLDFVEMPKTKDLRARLRGMFFEEVRNRGNAPLPSSPYWARTFLVTNINTRVDHMVKKYRSR